MVQLVDPAYEQEVLADLTRWRQRRYRATVRATLARLKADAENPDVNLMAATLACARAGVTTGEWAFALREVFGEYRAPTGIGPFSAAAAASSSLAAVRLAVDATAGEIGRADCACSWASPASMGIPTASSRSPSGPATPGSR